MKLTTDAFLGFCFQAETPGMVWPKTPAVIFFGSVLFSGFEFAGE